MYRAKCLCERIEIEFESQNDLVFNCHCKRCQKAHGAVFSTQIISSFKSFKINKGVDSLKSYQFKNIQRYFCENCGSRVFNTDTQRTYLSVAFSLIENPKPKLNLMGECFINQKSILTKLNANVSHFERLPEI